MYASVRTRVFFLFFFYVRGGTYELKPPGFPPPPFFLFFLCSFVLMFSLQRPRLQKYTVRRLFCVSGDCISFVCERTPFRVFSCGILSVCFRFSSISWSEEMCFFLSVCWVARALTGAGVVLGILRDRIERGLRASSGESAFSARPRGKSDRASCFFFIPARGSGLIYVPAVGNNVAFC